MFFSYTSHLLTGNTTGDGIFFHSVWYPIRMKLFSFILSPFGKKWRTLLFLIIAVVILMISVANRLKKPAYTTDTVKRATVTQTVTDSGVISSNNTVAVYSPATGTITEVYVQNGQEVKKGDQLFRAQSSATRAETQKAYADYLSAKSSLEVAQAQSYALQSDMFSAWDTYKSLAQNDTYEKSDGIPDEEKRTLPQFQTVQKDWLAAEAKYKSQSSVIAQATALTSAMYEAYMATRDALVVAPSDGIVANLAVIPGSGVAINSALAPVPPVLSLLTAAATEAVLTLSEDDVMKLTPGQKATITVDAIDGKTYHGTVARVDTVGRDVKGVVRYYAYLTITDPDAMVLPGMNLDAAIVTSEKSDVLSVPNSAVKPYQGGKAVRIPSKTKEGYTFVPVTTGIRSSAVTEITGGLSDGQIVISALAADVKKPGLFGM